MAKMLCHIILPNSSVFEVEVDPKADGQICLDKVFEVLGVSTIEADYFGLQYAGEKGELLWLNMRNRMSQLTGPQPHRLRLRVKFFVQPHFILQESARHLFYQQMKQEFLTDNLKVSDPTTIAHIAGHIAQVDLGDLRESAFHPVQYRNFLPAHHRDNDAVLRNMAQTHSRLVGVQRNSAEYKTLQLMSALEAYGVEYHQACWHPTGHAIHVGVGPEGISIYHADWTLERSIAYPTVQTATNERRCVYLDMLNDDGQISQIVFKLVSQKAANGLYRSVTEMHSFYRCDTVRNAVVSQFSRDLKGTLASLFNENTSLGKKYVFDIRRTCREVYDHARRVLYTSGNALTLPTRQLDSPAGSEGAESMDHDHRTECQALKEQLQHIQDSLLCCACMDAPINMMFMPCSHVACCASCCERLETCPLCRTAIQQSQPIYLPNVMAHHAISASSTSPMVDNPASPIAMATEEPETDGAMAASN